MVFDPATGRWSWSVRLPSGRARGGADTEREAREIVAAYQRAQVEPLQYRPPRGRCGTIDPT